MYEENIKLEIEPDEVNNTQPKLIFIVPYRDREQHKSLFLRQMQYVLEDIPKRDYEIYFAHQCDNRDFNRGAMKNIGFLAMKQKYPEHYQNITFIFNDVDTMPYAKGLLQYNTVHGNVKHFYGFKYTLGGIVSITGSDYEKTNGYPNLWAWGYEDNAFQQRVMSSGLHIDRSQFYSIMDENILQIYHGTSRIVNRGEFDKFKQHTTDGLSIISNIEYQVDDNTHFINITNFVIPTIVNQSKNIVYDLRNGNTIFTKRGGLMKLGLIRR